MLKFLKGLLGLAYFAALIFITYLIGWLTLFILPIAVVIAIVIILGSFSFLGALWLYDYTFGHDKTKSYGEELQQAYHRQRKSN